MASLFRGTGDSKRIKQAHKAYGAGLDRAGSLFSEQRNRQSGQFDNLDSLYGTSFLPDARQSGVAATARINQLLFGQAPAQDILDRTPGYQFALDEGNKQIQRNAALRGLQGSGATARSLTEFGQNTARQAYNSYLSSLQGQQQLGTSIEQNRLRGLAGSQHQRINLDVGLTNRLADLEAARGQNQADERLNLLTNRASNREAALGILGLGGQFG